LAWARCARRRRAATRAQSYVLDWKCAGAVSFNTAPNYFRESVAARPGPSWVGSRPRFGMCLGMPFYVARPHIMADEFVPGHLGDRFGLLPFAHGNPLANEFHGPFLVGLIRKEVPHSSGFPFKIEGCDPHIPSCCHERHYAPQLSPVNSAPQSREPTTLFAVSKGQWR